MGTINWDDPTSVEAFLEAEGLGDIDIDGQYSSENYSVLGILSSSELSKKISDINNKFGLTVSIDHNDCSVSFWKGELQVGIMRPLNYSYLSVEKTGEEHLEKEISEDFRGKGLGKLLYQVYISNGFPIPENEHSHTGSSILFLLKYCGYELTHRATSSGYEELSDSEIHKILEEICMNDKKIFSETFKLTRIN